MKSYKIPMTVDDFYTAEFPFGWKDEYCDGFAYFTPRDHGVLMKVGVEPRPLENSVGIKLISETTFEKLIELFYASFAIRSNFAICRKAKSKNEPRKM